MPHISTISELNISAVATIVALLTVLAGRALSAQDKYALKVPDGLGVLGF